MALLAVGQLHVQLFKAGLGRHALLDIGELGLDFGQIGRRSALAGARLLGQLAQAQGLDLQLVGGFATRSRRADTRRCEASA
jgi:hypothetical protein